MSAGITKTDSMFSVRETPWHGLGLVTERYPKTIDEAIKWAGLDWDVEQYPVAAKLGTSYQTLIQDPSQRELPKEQREKGWDAPLYYVNVRSDTKEPLGIVTGRYKTVPNRDAFSFLNHLFGSMNFETAGSLMGGRRVWVLMKLPEYVEVGGDPIGQYAFVSNSHDGKSSVLVAMTPVRIVCQNTLGMALNRAKGRDAQRTYALRHLGNMSEKLAEARQTLDVTINYYEQFKAVGDKLALTKLSDKRAKAATELLFPKTEGMGDRAAKNRDEARRVVMDLFKLGQTASVEQSVKGDTRPQNALGTAWAWYNAATEYADHARGERKVGGRFQRAIDDPDWLKSKSFEIALDLAGSLG